MAQTRQASRVPGKSDPIDALAVARAALQEPNLPQARLDGPARELRLLVAHREDLVAERTRIENRLRWHLHDLDPERAARLPTRHLEQRRVLDELETWLADLPDSVQVGIVLELVGRCRELTLRAHELQAELGRRGGPVPLQGGLGHARRGSAVGVLLRGLAAPSPLSDR
jgi:transposase